MDELMDKVDSKYTMVVLAAKRARQLVEGAAPSIHPTSSKPVTVALEELAAGKLSFERQRQGIK
ncbi:MAG: DNA-directed RNA polymerase subunit omega [Clostridia bacterium]|nr:DNA-directed RNA polymerase subunit omega [Clostridia bacterium]